MKKINLKHCSYAMLCLFLGYGYYQSEKQIAIQKEVAVIDFETYRQVVYIDKDDVLIPVSYTIEDCPTIQAEAQMLFSMMKDAGSLNKELSSIIPKTTQLDSVILQDDILQLHLNDYDGQNELRFLEGLTFVFCQLDGVSGIDFYIKGNKINQFPNGNIVWNEPLDRSLGINNFETGVSDLYKSKPVTVYYSKTINQEEFYVPISQRISATSTLEDELETIMGEISVTSTLQQASLLDELSLLDGSYLEGGHLYVNVNDEALFDETTINQDIYDLLLLSFSQLDGVSEVTLMVNGEMVESREVVSVSEIVYNIVKI